MNGDLKLLLVGPVPPPHGGISVHVAALERQVRAAGLPCRVLDLGRGPEEARSRFRRLAILGAIRRQAADGWTPHLHTNGHNLRSWLLVLACAQAGERAPTRLLTLHSGLLPRYLVRGPVRRLAALALRRYDRVICVNERIQRTIEGLGVPAHRLQLAPAYLGAPATGIAPPGALADWLERHSPVLVATQSYRPEYGFEVLLDALPALRSAHPRLGCLVLGGSARGRRNAQYAVNERRMRGWVRLAGDVDHDVCLSVIDRCDVFVRPTLADGDALSIREALALEVPVVASDAVERPPGVLLCRRGDPQALAEAVGRALAGETAPAVWRAAAPASDTALRAYQELSPLLQEAPCPAS